MIGHAWVSGGEHSPPGVFPFPFPQTPLVTATQNMVTFGHVTKMAVTLFDPPYPQTPCSTRKFHGSMFYRTGVISDQSFTLRDWEFPRFLLL